MSIAAAKAVPVNPNKIENIRPLLSLEMIEVTIAAYLYFLLVCVN